MCFPCDKWKIVEEYSKLNSWPLFMKTAGLLSIRQERESKAKVSFQDTAGRLSEFREIFKPMADIPFPPLQIKEE